MKLGKVYVVDWLDHCEAKDSGQAWVEVADIDASPCLLRSVGFLVKLTAETIVLAHTLQNGQSSAPFTIIRAAIVREEEIRLPPLRRAKKKGAT